MGNIITEPLSNPSQSFTPPESNHHPLDLSSTTLSSSSAAFESELSTSSTLAFKENTYTVPLLSHGISENKDSSVVSERLTELYNELQRDKPDTFRTYPQSVRFSNSSPSSSGLRIDHSTLPYTHNTCNTSSSSSASFHSDRKNVSQTPPYFCTTDNKSNDRIRTEETIPSINTEHVSNHPSLTIRINFPRLISGNNHVVTVPILLPLYYATPSSESSSSFTSRNYSTIDSVDNTTDALFSLSLSSTPSLSSSSSSRASSPSSDPESPRYNQKSEITNQQQLHYYTHKLSIFAPWLYLSGENPPRNRNTLIKHKIGMIINCAGEVVDNTFESGIPCTIADFIRYYGNPVTSNTTLDQDSGKYISIDRSSISNIPVDEYSRYFFYVPVSYLTLSLRDGPFEDIVSLFFRVFYAIEYTRNCGLRVLIHCHQGVSRSPSFVMGYLMWMYNLPFTVVYNYVRKIRSIVSPNMGFLCQLKEWEYFIQQYRITMQCSASPPVDPEDILSHHSPRKYFTQPLVYRLQRIINGSYTVGPLFMTNPYDDRVDEEEESNTKNVPNYERVWKANKQNILYTFQLFRSEINRTLLSLSSDLLRCHSKDIFFTITGISSDTAFLNSTHYTSSLVHGWVWFGPDNTMKKKNSPDNIVSFIQKELWIWENVENLTRSNLKDIPSFLSLSTGIDQRTEVEHNNSIPVTLTSSVEISFRIPLHWHLQYIHSSSSERMDNLRQEDLFFRYIDNFHFYYSPSLRDEIRYCIQHPQATLLYDIPMPNEESFQKNLMQPKPSFSVSGNTNISVPTNPSSSSNSNEQPDWYPFSPIIPSKYSLDRSTFSTVPSSSIAYGTSNLRVENHGIDEAIIHDLSNNWSNTSSPLSVSPSDYSQGREYTTGLSSVVYPSNLSSSNFRAFIKPKAVEPINKVKGITLGIHNITKK